VIPVWNEGAHAAELCRALRAACPPGYETLVVFDFDDDDTLPALAAVPATDQPENLRTVKNELGRGVRWAIEAGMRAARAPVVVVTMADLSDDYRALPEMIARAETGAALVTASRYIPGGRQDSGPWLKRQLSRAAGLSLHHLAGLPIHDPTNSFKAYRKDFLAATPIESSEGFCLALELSVKAHFGGWRIEEVPATWTDRSAGQSRFRLWKWLPSYLRWWGWAMGRRWWRKL
jgi:glycosyltransferase involved in cell wall biosynthesis